MVLLYIQSQTAINLRLNVIGHAIERHTVHGDYRGVVSIRKVNNSPVITADKMALIIYGTEELLVTTDIGFNVMDIKDL